MKRPLLLLIMTGSSILVHAQHNCILKKAYAYYTQTMPGNIFQDDKGNPVHPQPVIDRVLYMECSGSKMPVLEKVLYNTLPMRTSISRAEGTKMHPGKLFLDGKDIFISIKPGNTIWKIIPEINPENKIVPAGCTNIIIRIRSTGRSCQLALKPEIELIGMPVY